MTDWYIYRERKGRKWEVEIVIGDILMSAKSKRGREKTDLDLCVQNGLTQYETWWGWGRDMKQAVTAVCKV